MSGFTTVTEGAVLSSGAVTQTANGALFSAEGTSVLLYGVDLNSLSEADFIFA
uniref:Uncharacterized protein n=1 Tax=Yoonia rhodophyticola TaxID=3137370 RepID=A0AAN0NKE7_9RHOB